MISNPAKQHNNVLRMLDWHRQDGHGYLILEHCNGGDLHDLISENGMLDETTAKTIFKQLLIAIQYLHGRGIIHIHTYGRETREYFHTEPFEWNNRCKAGRFWCG
ncbi:hypothetical protein ABG067_000839 [Albugo candida]